MEEIPPFSWNIQVNLQKYYLFVTGNTCDIITKDNGKIGIRLQSILIDLLLNRQLE